MVAVRYKPLSFIVFAPTILPTNQLFNAQEIIDFQAFFDAVYSQQKHTHQCLHTKNSKFNS